MQAQIQKPTRSVCNSESAFVVQNLHNAGYFDEAAKYWSFVCSGGTRHIADPEIIELYRQLKQIDIKSSMPAWGTYGTQMRDKLITRIYKLAEATDLNIEQDLKKLSNDELIGLFHRVAVENYLFEQYLEE